MREIFSSGQTVLPDAFRGSISPFPPSFRPFSRLRPTFQTHSSGRLIPQIPGDSVHCSPHPVVHHQPVLPPLYPCSLIICMEPGNRRTWALGRQRGAASSCIPVDSQIWYLFNEWVDRLAGRAGQARHGKGSQPDLGLYRTARLTPGR